MNELTVKKVVFYGDETASVTLESDSSSVDVFCHLCQYKEGDKVNNLLQVLDAEVKTAYLDDWPVEIVKEKSQERLEKTGPYSYTGCGKAVDLENGIIEVNGFLIETNEILHSSAVEFEINRLDLW